MSQCLKLNPYSFTHLFQFSHLPVCYSSFNRQPQSVSFAVVLGSWFQLSIWTVLSLTYPQADQQEHCPDIQSTPVLPPLCYNLLNNHSFQLNVKIFFFCPLTWPHTYQKPAFLWVFSLDLLEKYFMPEETITCGIILAMIGSARLWQSRYSCCLWHQLPIGELVLFLCSTSDSTLR